LVKTLKYLFAFALVVSTIRLSAQAITLQCDHPTGCAPHGVIVTATMADGSTVGSTSWTIQGPDGIALQSTSNPYVAIFNVPGTYDITITAAAGVGQFFNDFITVFAKPTAAITVSDPAGCLPFCPQFQDASTTGSGAIVEWVWDFGDGVSSGSQNPQHCYDQQGTFTPVLSVEDVNGCFSSVTMPQLIQASSQLPVADFNIGSQSSCTLPTAITFTANHPEYVHYTWLVDGIASNQNSATGSVTFQQSSTYIVCLAVENAIGCVDTTCREVSISTQPYVGFTTVSDTTCAGQTLQFVNTTSPAPTSVEWDFNSDGVVDGTGLNGTYTFSNAGTYNVRMTAHFGTACSMMHSETVVAMPNPIIDFTADITSGCSVPLEVHFTNGSASQSGSAFSWYINDQVVSTDVNLTYTFNETGVYAVKLRRISEAGCVRNKSRSNYIHIETPGLSFEHEEAICTGETMGVSNIVVSSGAQILSYSWDMNGDGLEDASGANPNFIFNEPGEYYPRLSVTTSDGCAAIDTSDLALSVFQPIIPDFTVNQSLGCAGINFEFCLEYQPGSTYIWDFHDGAGPFTMEESDSCITRAFEDTGYFDVSLAIIHGACNLELTRENFIRVVPPLALFSYEMTCSEFGVQFTDESIEGDSLIWDFGDDSPDVINVSNPIHYYAEPGMYTVTLTAHKNGDWCSDSKTEVIHITSPTARIDITPTVGCSPLEVHVDNQRRNMHWELNVENGDQVVVDRVYNLGSPPWSIVYTRSGQSTTSYSNDPLHFDWPTLVFEEVGVYDIQVRATNYQGCTADTTYIDAVTVLQGGEFSEINHVVLNPCSNGAVVVGFSAANTQSTNWNWTFSDGAIDTNATLEHTFLPPFDYEAGIAATLTASNADSCQSTHTIIVDAVLPPQSHFDISDFQLCREETTLFNNTSSAPNQTNYSWNFGDGSSVEFNSNTQHAYLNNGQFTVCLTAINSVGCASTYCHPNPVIVQSPDAQAILNPEINNCLFTVSFNNNTTGNIASTQWNFGDAQSGLGDFVAHTYPIGVFDATLITSLQNGCADTLFLPDILDYSSSVGPFSQVLDSALCAPYDVAFEAFNVADNSFQYFWDFNDGHGDPFGGTTTSHTYTEPGEYCPSIIMTDQNGCDVYIHCTTPIHVENFQAQFTLPTHICEGDNIEIIGNNIDQFIWSSAPQLLQGAEANSALMLIDSSTHVIFTTRFADCISTDTLEITVDPKPQVTLQLVDSICFNSGLIALTGGSPVGNGGYYFFNTIEADSMSTDIASNTYQTVTYSFTDENGCTGWAADSIFILPLPSIPALEPREFCDDDDVFVFAVDSTVESHYTINGITTNSFFPTYSASPYAVELHYFDGYGCSTTSATQYVVHPKPLLNPVVGSSCSNSEITVSGNATLASGEIVLFQWVLDSAIVGINEDLSGLYYESGGLHAGEYSAQSEFGCSSRATIELMVYDTPNAAFELTNVCEKDSTMLVDISTIGNDSVVERLWFTGGLSWGGEDTAFFIFDNSGPATVALHITTEHGCVDAHQQQVIVRPMPQIQLHTANNCLGTTTSFSADVDVSYGGITSATWEIEGYPFVSVGYETEYLFDSAGIYNYSISVESSYGCNIRVDDSVEVYPKPAAEIVLAHTELCSNQSANALCNATIQSPSGIDSYRWYLDGENISNENPAHISISEIGAYALEVVVNSNRGCATHVSMSEPVIVYPTPEAGFTWTIDQSTPTPTIIVSPDISADAVVVGYNWGDGSEGGNSSQHAYSTNGLYEIIQVVTNTFGCVAEISHTIEAGNDYEFFIPSAFSPDQNNHNELFLPVLTGSNITLYTFRIYNRWGIEVFTSHIMGEGWDGTFNGKPVEDGVYAWSVDMIVQGKPSLISEKGSVTLLR